eukprot:CAMPEP_0197528668 /NCGR_PEP_ID=MMETSP1318-20131121/25939_1 /TAXON_ID=552666 /ORGANISM="Partenskyella glossopodia, Strain RCC365" /LENGTH=153 /DNA_ID=CAMNT_0043083857 /DNA_START=81 /DNA_END=539 /DNA_ORIENTATION=-
MASLGNFHVSPAPEVDDMNGIDIDSEPYAEYQLEPMDLSRPIFASGNDDDENKDFEEYHSAGNIEPQPESDDDSLDDLWDDPEVVQMIRDLKLMFRSLVKKVSYDMGNTFGTFAAFTLATIVGFTFHKTFPYKSIRPARQPSSGWVSWILEAL